jgi:hypothetical protein
VPQVPLTGRMGIGPEAGGSVGVARSGNESD